MAMKGFVFDIQHCLGATYQTHVYVTAWTRGFPENHIPEHHTSSTGLPSSPSETIPQVSGTHVPGYRSGDIIAPRSCSYALLSSGWAP